MTYAQHGRDSYRAGEAAPLPCDSKSRRGGAGGRSERFTYRVGKSTLLSHIAEVTGRHVLDCDDPAVRAAVRNDPGRFVTGPGPILIDEYQHVPELLDAIKSELNRDLSPGRFVLAGSTRYSTLPQAGRSLTGRVDIVDVLPLSQGEVDGTRETLVHRLLNGESLSDFVITSRAGHDDYARRITSGECRWRCAARPADQAPAGMPTISSSSSIEMCSNSAESVNVR
ncbi:AAA family ATPase [Nocardia rhizosphaerae]|uniref:AAA family ATPase n=1 Tax=Nocardia rhizosphaerae TaxID=1691571 RepID=A0ABV8L6F1_9NOCA